MPQKLADMLRALDDDPWRREAGFSRDLHEASEKLWERAGDEEAAAQVLGQWLQRHQPCLFGRAAAALGLMHYCILSPDDLHLGDDHVSERIQTSRRAWKKAAFDGEKSGFVILALSPEIASATPGPVTRTLAGRICSLYLQEEVTDDEIFLDDLYLEVPGKGRATFQWRVGVNYFCAQGDMRWWHDHRIPGGLAFSMNSIGHMVKSRKLARRMTELWADLGVLGEDPVTSNIDSLGKALVFAMRTIGLASDTRSGRATELLPADASRGLPDCPVELPQNLRDKNHCEYRGYYHTDSTIPTAYFQPHVARPDDQPQYALDFTYLFHDSTTNPDFRTMGEGVRIRADVSQRERRRGKAWKNMKSVGTQLSDRDAERVRNELGSTG